VKRTRECLAALALALMVGVAMAGCGHKIGDNCLTSADCDPNGNRTCDLSQLGGYCTVDGCDDKSCPSESVCIRTFPEKYLSKPCDPLCEDLDCAGQTTATCQCAGAATNDCTADELCLDTGVCARRAFERRYCASTCGGNGDCRAGYECRAAGTRGNIALLTSLTGTAQFCAQHAD
jgi:hypothetical protein